MDQFADWDTDRKAYFLFPDEEKVHFLAVFDKQNMDDVLLMCRCSSDRVRADAMLCCTKPARTPHQPRLSYALRGRREALIAVRTCPVRIRCTTIRFHGT